MKKGDLVKIAVTDMLGIILDPDFKYEVDAGYFVDFCKIITPRGKILTIHKDFIDEVISERRVGKKVIQD